MVAFAAAHYHILTGRPELAIEVLEDAYEKGMRYSILRRYPPFAQLHDHPRLIALSDKIHADINIARIELGLLPSED